MSQDNRNPTGQTERAHALEILKAVKRDQGTNLGIVEIGIFGSLARGDSRPDSDVDVCVVTRSADPFLLVLLRDELESRLQRKVDVVRVRDKMNPFLKQRIERDGIYV